LQNFELLPHQYRTSQLNGVSRNFSREGFWIFFVWTGKLRGFGIFFIKTPSKLKKISQQGGVLTPKTPPWIRPCCSFFRGIVRSLKYPPPNSEIEISVRNIFRSILKICESSDWTPSIKKLVTPLTSMQRRIQGDSSFFMKLLIWKNVKREWSKVDFIFWSVLEYFKH